MGCFFILCLCSKKHKACAKKHKAYILKYKALILKYVPCIFFTCQVFEQQQLTKEVEKGGICRIISVLRKISGFSVFSCRGFVFTASIPAFPVKKSPRTATLENCSTTYARNFFILIAYICRRKSFLSIP